VHAGGQELKITKHVTKVLAGALLGEITAQRA
jgi:hypothetical protein